MDMAKRVYRQLKTVGVDAYLPGQKQGKCTAPYALVRNGGVYPQSRTTGMRIIIISCYAPIGRATDLIELTASVRAAMLGLKRDIRPTGNETEQTINIEYEAHETAIEYAALCAI